MTDQSDILNGWQDERSSAAIYQILAEAEKDPRLADVYRRMAEAERQHARKWEEKADASGLILPVFKPDFRTRILIWMARSCRACKSVKRKAA
jgi:glutathione S-transferase